MSFVPNFPLLSKTNCIIISHKEDLDGIVSAALLKYVVGLTNPDIDIQIILTNYREMCGNLDQLRSRWSEQAILMADLGINEKNAQIFQQISPISTTDSIHLYFDHHHIPENSEGIELHLEKIFNRYLNGVINFNVNLTEACTADLILHYFQLQINPHFVKLAKIAHLMDFQPNRVDPYWDLATALKKIINYYQSDSYQLLRLINVMQIPETWVLYESNLPKILKEIDKWILDQYKLIDNNKEEFHIRNFKIISAVADLRAGEITHYVQEKYPDFDLYIGLSKKEQYMNVRMKIPIAHKIAAEFGGGGHPDRSGFEIPEIYWKSFKKNMAIMKIPYGLISEILLLFAKYNPK